MLECVCVIDVVVDNFGVVGFVCDYFVVCVD